MTPLLLVTGILGSGKTTFLKNLVASARAEGFRIALVINEYGAVDIDSSILRAENAELLASVAGGCACCSGQDEFVEVLTELGSRPVTSRPQAIIIEASGLADAALLLETIATPALLTLVRPQAVVCVVDALRWSSVMSQAGELVIRQIALADFLLVNKADQAPPGAADGLATALRNSNHHASVLVTSYAAFDFALLWPALLQAEARIPLASAGGQHHANAHAVVCPVPHPVDREPLALALAGLDDEVWRAKGFVRVRGFAGVQLLQFTGGRDRRWNLAPFHLPPGMDEPELQLVFLGATLDEAGLRRTFGGHALSGW